MTYRQVALHKVNEDWSVSVDTVWIPSQYAILGKYLERCIDGLWSNGWQVEEVYSFMKVENVREIEQERRSWKNDSSLDGGS